MSVQCTGSGFVQGCHKVIHWYVFDVDLAVCGCIALRPTLVPVFAPAPPPTVLEPPLCTLTKLDAPGNPKTDPARFNMCSLVHMYVNIPPAMLK